MENNNLINLKKLQPAKKDESVEVEKYLAELEQLRRENQNKARQETMSPVEKKEDGTKEEKNPAGPGPAAAAVRTFWLKLGKRFMYLLIFLLPLFFLPITIYPIDANKQFLAAILISASLLCYLADCYFSRKIIYSRSILILATVFFVISGGLSALFSVSPSNSFYGDFSQADVFVGRATHGKGEVRRIAANFKKHPFETLDRTHDELAKEHIRHMVGGHSKLAQNERLLRFVFPERPGALLKFLSLLRPGWNISLFHYRNQGADYGRILVGLQVPASDTQAFDKFLKTLGYPCVEETDNPVYRMFLQS